VSAATAAFAQRRRQRAMVAAFAAAGATTAHHARTPEALGIGTRLRTLQRLRDAGVVRMASPGRYWADLAAWDALRRRRVRLVLAMSTAALFGLAAMTPAVWR
jgi:hypothetical protein